MFGMKFYTKDDEESKKDLNDNIFIVDGNKNDNFELKQEYFNKCKSYSEEKLGDDDHDLANENINLNEESNTVEKINPSDDGENVYDKLYVISMDGIPYYYEDDLVSARTKMWAIANNLLKKDSLDEFDNTNYIFTNNLNKVSLISPYNFFGLNYHHTICELQIDYVVRYNNDK